MAVIDHLHQVAPLLGGEASHRPVVEDQQLDAGEASEQPGGIAVDARQGQLVEQPRQPLIAHREAAARRLVAEGASNPALADPGRAREILPKNSPSRFSSTTPTTRARVNALT
jgi:hypothetical protein